MKILISGSIALDRIMLYNGRFADVIRPEKLHVLSLSVLIDQLRETRGGVAANIAYTLALFGEKPILFGSVGTNAREYMEVLGHLGVDISHVHYSKLPTATYSVITDKADCQVGGFYPGAMSDASSLSISEFSEENVFVVISPHDPKQMSIQVQECVKLQKPFFYDVGQQVTNITKEDLLAGLHQTKLLIVNDYEMGVIEEKAGISQDELVKMIPTVVVTLGERGSVVWQQGKRSTVAAIVSIDIQDPTGAGDAFRAGFLYGMMHDADPVTCAQLGSTAATYCIESTGTQEHFFTKEQFREKYKKQFGTTSLLE